MNKTVLILGIIFLLIGASVVSSNSLNIGKSQIFSYGGKTLYVGGSGPGNYTYINDAVRDANDGDTVFVYDDSSPYNGAGINKSINLIGEDKNTTVIGRPGDSSCIQIYDTNYVNISGFTVVSSRFGGIIIRDSYNISVKGNIMKECDTGVELSHSHYCSIIDNEIIDRYSTSEYIWGIDVCWYSSHNIISNNRISNMGLGIGLRTYSNNNIIHDNTLTKCGFSIDSISYPNTFFGNSVNNKSFLYLVNKQDMVIEGDDIGEVVLINCENITVQNLEIKDAAHGVELIHSKGCFVTNNYLWENEESAVSILGNSSKNTISYNYIFSNANGIEFAYDLYDENRKSNNISNNDIISNWNRGIWIHNSNGNIVSNNNFQENYIGIFLEGNGEGNQIYNNAIKSSSYSGIFMTGNPNPEGDNMIYNNLIQGNDYGIYLDMVNEVNYNFVLNKYFVLSGFNTCLMDFISKTNDIVGSSDGRYIIYENDILYNKKDGIYSSLSRDNVIYHNNFIGNSRNALGKCYPNYRNIWNLELNDGGGNYWDDYIGVDINGDNIGDTPYKIPDGDIFRSKNDKDYFPLMQPYGYVQDVTVNQVNNVNIFNILERLLDRFPLFQKLIQQLGL
jgi:parallel beta-helix repeat protein